MKSVFELKRIFIIGILCLSLSSLVIAQGTVPYSTGFDTTDTPAFAAGSLAGQNGWTVPSGTATVQNTTIQGGDQAVMLDAESEVKKDFAAAGIGKVWIDAYFRGAGSTAEPTYPTDPHPSAIVHFSQTNGIQCYNGNGTGGGAMENTGDTIDPAQWYRISIFQNYSTKKWDCYVNATSKKTQMGFVWNDVTQFNGFINFSGEVSYLDTFRVVSGIIGDANGDGKIDIADVVKIVNHINGTLITDFILLKNADTNTDTSVNAADLQAVVNIIKGQI